MEETVLPSKFSSGPLGLGDPNDYSLRKVEREILIPQKVRDKAKLKCTGEVKAFENCCKENGMSMVLKCQTENASLKQCLEHWYKDEELKKNCTQEYLIERSQYRSTGVKKSLRRKKVESP